MTPPLTLGDFRRETAHLPDDTLLVTYEGYECEEVLSEGWVVEDYVVEWNLPERRASIAELLTGMGGPGRTPKRTQLAIRLG